MTQMINIQLAALLRLNSRVLVTRVSAKDCNLFYAKLCKINRHLVSANKQAIIVPMCGSTNFKQLAQHMARKSSYSLHCCKKLLGHVGHRQHCADYKRITATASRRYGSSGPITEGSCNKTVNLNKELAKEHEYASFLE